MSEARIVAGAAEAEDRLDSGLRPRKLDDFVGQRAVRENLRVFIAAASERGEALDHVLFYGPPGLGKTTLAQIVARELGVGIRATSGPVIARAGDLAAILTNLNERDVLFIDEIHRLNPAVEEILYPAMEDSQLDLIIGEGPGARSVRIDLPPFTLVGATTRTGLITTPLRERFGIPLRLDFYEVDELVEIVSRNAGLLDVALSADGAAEVAAPAPAARRASPAACCAGCATSRRSPEWKPSMPPSRIARSTGWRSTSAASIRWTGATSPASRRTTAAARSGSRPSPRRSPNSVTRWRK